jgi:hypothetical protein
MAKGRSRNPFSRFRAHADEANHEMNHYSEYMEWAKLHSGATYKLALSGVDDQTLDVLGADWQELALHGPNSYGYAPLHEAIGERYGVSDKCVVTVSGGASFANHLALAALCGRGDEVLLEQPVYDPILSVLRYLGADVRRFARRFEDGFAIDTAELARLVTPRVKLIALTNLHNPGSALTDNETMREIGALARSVGARVLVDEVYLDAMHEARQPSSATLGDEFVVTSSLTKAFGLSGLRCGWVLAAEDVAESMRRFNDLFGVIMPHITERLSVAAFRRLDELSATFAPMLAHNRQLWHEFLDAHTDTLRAPHTEFGTTSFPRLLRGDVETLCQKLRAKETTVVPGRFFEMPQHFRIGLCGKTETLEKGLKNLHDAL